MAKTTRRNFLKFTTGLGITLGLNQLISKKVTANITQAYPYSDLIELTINETPLTIANKNTKAVTINNTIPGQLIRLKEGQTATIKVTNNLKEDTSIHWHGIILPANMDGVPGVSFRGIKPKQTFTYQFQVNQSGTYWYHSHSGLQEQQGHFGALIIDPIKPDPFEYDQDHVILLSDWTFENPRNVLANLKKMPTFYNHQRRTIRYLAEDWEWKGMRMDPVDIADVTGATYTYLMNGLDPESNFTALFKPGNKVRLRFINASAMTFFDVRIPGLKITVVQADGQNIQPVIVDEFRIGTAETYDIIVEPKEEVYTIFAETMDRSGYARGTLTISQGMSAPIPERRKRPVRTMTDMGMDHGEHSNMNHGISNDAQINNDMSNMDHSNMNHNMSNMDHSNMNHNMSNMDHSNMNHDTYNNAQMNHDMSNMNHSSMNHDMSNIEHSSMNHDMSNMEHSNMNNSGFDPTPVRHGDDNHGIGNAAIPMMVKNRLSEPGIGLENTGTKVLVYTDIKSLEPGSDQRKPERELEVHITGNMERYMWSFDGKKHSEQPYLNFNYGERLRLTFVNDTMMEHPIHLHGMWMELDNGAGEYKPKKHTLIVKPAEKCSVEVNVDAPGKWAFHCHLLYHMETGMMRTVIVNS